MTLKLCQLIKYLMRNIFLEKSCRKWAPKASATTPFYFGKQPKTAIACKKILLKIRYFERGLSKPFKKLTIFFLFEPSPF